MGGHDTQEHSMKLEWSGYPLYPEDVKNNFPGDELWALRYLFFYGNHKSPLLPVDDDADYLINLLAAINSIYEKYQNTPTNHIYDTFSSTVRHAIEYKTKTLTGETIHNLAKPNLEQGSAEELQHLYAMAALFFKTALRHDPEEHVRLNKNINRYLKYSCELNNIQFDGNKTDKLFIKICKKLQIYLSPKKVEERISKSKEYMGYKNFDEQAKYKRTAANLALACVTKELNILQNPQTTLDEGDIHFASEASDTASSDNPPSGDKKSSIENGPHLSSEPTSSNNIVELVEPDSTTLKEQTPRHRHCKTPDPSNDPNKKDKITTKNPIQGKNTTGFSSYAKFALTFAASKLGYILPSSQKSNYKPLPTKTDAREPNKYVTNAQPEMPPTPRCTS